MCAALIIEIVNKNKGEKSRIIRFGWWNEHQRETLRVICLSFYVYMYTWASDRAIGNCLFFMIWLQHMLDDEHTQQQQHSHKIGGKKTGLMRLWLPVCLTNIVYMSASEVHIWVDSLGRFYFSKHIAVFIDKKETKLYMTRCTPTCHRRLYMYKSSNMIAHVPYWVISNPHPTNRPTHRESLSLFPASFY